MPREAHGARLLGVRSRMIESSMQRHEQRSFDANDEYSGQLTTRDLIAELRRLLASQRRGERLICRYLADLADGVRDRRDHDLAAYVDEFHAARCFFQLGVRETRERVRVGRALRQLPEIEQAFITGTLSYSRVREDVHHLTAQAEGGAHSRGNTAWCYARRTIACCTRVGFGSLATLMECSTRATPVAHRSENARTNATRRPKVVVARRMLAARHGSSRRLEH
jgi:hypothetical protein